MESGSRVGTGRHTFQKELIRLAQDSTADLWQRILLMLSDMAMELDAINGRIGTIDTEIRALAKSDVDMQGLMEIPDVGPTTATTRY